MCRWIGIGALAALAAALAWPRPPEASAQPAPQKIETKTAKAAPPKQPPLGAAATRLMPPPNATALMNRKQQRLRKHHLRIPLGGRPLGAAPMAKPPAESAASVSTALLPEAAGKVKLLASHALTAAETKGQTATVGEPSVADRGQEVLLTANWFAAFSHDGGATFQYRNPAGTFPASSHGEFCCDQIALYVKSKDLMLWLLQYVSDDTGNVLRLAVAAKDDITKERWRYYDFSPQDVGGWSNEWFDFPDLVAGSKYLYLSSNTFSTPPEQFRRSVLLRLNLDELAAYKGLTYQHFSSTQVGGLRATHGATDTMYFASHLNQATLRVFTWPENSTSVQQQDVKVDPWNDNPREAAGPDGYNWLQRTDGRLTAAWASGANIGFGWTASQDAQFRFPHARFAVLDKESKKVVAQPHLWNNNLAFAYPAAAPNEDGVVGLSVHYGGGTLYPSHAVGTLVGNKTWELVMTAGGNSGPADGTWGDYLTVRRHGAEPKTWVATGFTLQGGPLRNNIEVRFIRFSR
jgi:hypothetical protein